MDGGEAVTFLLLVLLGNRTPGTSQATLLIPWFEATSFRMGGFIRSGATVSPSRAFKLK